MRNRPLDRIMTTSPTVAQPGTSIAMARKLMAKGTFHHLPVVQDGKLVGMLSAADMLQAQAGATVADSMQADPVSVRGTATLQDAAKLLATGMFHCLPVVDVSGMLVGMVTSTDLVRVLLEQLPSQEPGAAEGHVVPARAAAEFSEVSSLEAVVHAAEKLHLSGQDPERMAEAVLYLHAMNRLLDAVLRAADLYLHSGQGEQEHRDLVRRVQKAKEGVKPVLGIGRL